MKSFRSLLFLLLLLAVGAAPSRAAETTEPDLLIEAASPDGEFDYDLKTGVASAEKGVVVKYQDMVLTARRVVLFQEQGRLLAEGGVRLEREGQTWVGDSISYNYKLKRIDANDFRTAQGPFFAGGSLVNTEASNTVHRASDAYVTADDYAEPAYRVRARSVTIVAGKSIEARGATLYLGKVPVMYLPIYRRNLGRHPNNFEFVPGYRSRYGPYLLSTYNWYLNDRLDGALHLDYRVRRGLAGGADFNPHLGKWGDGQFQYYFAHDEDPYAGGFNQPVDEDRHRLWYLHKLSLTNDLTAKLAVRYQSDPMFLHDFFEREFQRNVQPSSFFEVNKQFRNWSVDAIAQPQLVNAFETVERLPDLRLTGYRQRLGESPFYYDSDSSFGWYQRRFADNLTPDYSAWRGDTYHQLLLPQNFFGWLNVTPRAGGRFTQYSAASGAGANTSAESRFVFNTGVEISTKASRVWPGARSRLLDVSGLRHIIEPGVNYVYVPEPNRRPPQLPQFDYELYAYRLLPMDFPDYNAIDSVDSQHALRLSLRNRLQTKRKTGVENLLYWAVCTDWRIDRRAGQGRFSDVYSDVEFSPRSWLILSSELRVDPGRGVLRQLDDRLTILPGDKWSLTVGNRYLKADPRFPLYLEENIYYTSVFYRLNENWGFRTSHHFEARDGRMEEQYYTIYRDLRSWTAALSLRLRDERTRPDDFTIAITFSLKAFPRYKLGRDADQPSILLGG